MSWGEGLCSESQTGAVTPKGKLPRLGSPHWCQAEAIPHSVPLLP